MNDNKNFENINNIILNVVKDLDGDEAFLIGSIIFHLSSDNYKLSKLYLEKLNQILKKKNEEYSHIEFPVRLEISESVKRSKYDKIGEIASKIFKKGGYKWKKLKLKLYWKICIISISDNILEYC